MKRTEIVNGDPDKTSSIHWGTAEKWIVAAVIALLGLVGSMLTVGVVAAARIGWENHNMLQRVVVKQESDEDKLERVLAAVESHVAWANGRSANMDELQRRIEAVERRK